MRAVMIQQAVINLGEGNPLPGILGLVSLVSVAVVIFSIALRSDGTTPRKDRPFRHVTTIFAVIAVVSIILGLLTSNL